jgi:hypothetical protein
MGCEGPPNWRSKVIRIPTLSETADEGAEVPRGLVTDLLTPQRK